MMCPSLWYLFNQSFYNLNAKQPKSLQNHEGKKCICPALNTVGKMVWKPANSFKHFTDQCISLQRFSMWHYPPCQKNHKFLKNNCLLVCHPSSYNGSALDSQLGELSSNSSLDWHLHSGSPWRAICQSELVICGEGRGTKQRSLSCRITHIHFLAGQAENSICLQAGELQPPMQGKQQGWSRRFTERGTGEKRRAHNP